LIGWTISMFNFKGQRIASRCSCKIPAGRVRFKQNWNEQWNFGKYEKYQVSWKCVWHFSSCYSKTHVLKGRNEPKYYLHSCLPRATPKQLHTECIMLLIAAHKEAQCLSCSASYSTAHLLYKYCTNCTVCNWTVLTVITHKLLLHVQLQNSAQAAQLISSEVQCSRLF